MRIGRKAMKHLILTMALLTVPAFAGRSDHPKTSPACDTVPVKIVTVRGEPDIVFVPVPLNIFYAQEILKPCKTPGLLRSVRDAKCYRKGREP